MPGDWEFIASSEQAAAEMVRPGLTYWRDVWQRFSKNRLALFGLILVTLIVLLAIFGPMFSPYSYSDQTLELSNIPPRVEVTTLFPGEYVYVHREYKLIRMDQNGAVLGVPKLVKDDKITRQKVYDIDGHEVILDYSPAAKKGSTVKYYLSVDGQRLNSPEVRAVWNKTYPLGTDRLGRDLWVRVLYGARISLLVGTVAALVNMAVGVIYGGISGYEGGAVDGLMMRFVDLINSIPLMLIVILLMVLFNRSGLGTIIFTIGLVYWVGMARQVRGQVLSLKEQEFVLAARTLGASKARIIFTHLIPNALGPIVVSMMMSIPSAIFTESFLSFVGLGVSAPQASWGTLANDALAGIRSFPYQLIAPSVAIALTMFGFNFVGDGLRDALDPRQKR